jgi:hypothetical protein
MIVYAILQICRILPFKNIITKINHQKNNIKIIKERDYDTY